ncbi:MAG: Cu(I)-responsive transcriptional regulator [Marinibacterium sp.]|nr:Cu(I)-responsive transcriptional regulator [Marinibacterium sp.]
MNIGAAATRTGLPAKTIRYYEDIGLVTPERASNGYRSYSDSDCHKLAFVGRARAHGFSVEDCRTLLALYEDQSRASADVKRLAQQHLTEIEAKISDLQQMHATLSRLVQSCAGDDRPDCPILSDFAKGGRG